CSHHRSRARPIPTPGRRVPMVCKSAVSPASMMPAYPSSSPSPSATTYRRQGWSISSASWNTFQASSGNSSSSAKAISSASASVAGRSSHSAPAEGTSAAPSPPVPASPAAPASRASPGASASCASPVVISAPQRGLAGGGLGGIRFPQVHRFGAGEVLALGGQLRRRLEQVARVGVDQLRGGRQQLGVQASAGAHQQVAGSQLLEHGG